MITDIRSAKESIPAEQSESNSPALTERIKRQAVSDVVSSARDMLVKSPVKIDLHDTKELIRVTDEYLSRCIRIGVLPTLQGVAASAGVSRRMIYKYLEDHEGTASADFLERLRAAFTQMRIEAVDRNAAKEVMSIFLLKNSSQGFRDKIDFEPIPPSDPYANRLSEDELKQKYLTDMAVDDDE